MLFGEHVRLRAIERSDIPTFVRWFNDPEVIENLLIYHPMSQAEEERWFEARLGKTDDFLFGIEAEVEEGRWLHIGNTGLHGIHWKDRSCTFGIAIGEKAYWNHGYGTEATRIILRFAFREANLHRVELEVLDFNRRAQRAYEKAGFRLIGTRRQALFRKGAYHDALLMDILADEFAG